jgi:hypothetical protein
MVMQLMLKYNEDKEQMPLFVLNQDGSLGYQVVFVAHQYATDDKIGQV